MVANTSLQIIIQAKDQASQIFKDVGRETEGLGSKLKTLAIGIGAAVAGFASFRVLEGAITDTAKLGEEVRNLTMQTGLSAESASGLIEAFNQVGLNADDASRSFGIFSKNLVNMRDNLVQGKAQSSPFADSLKVLHINAIGADGALLPLGTTLNIIADRFQRLPDGEEKAARAIDLFGRSGRDLIPLLNLGSEGLKEAAAEADKLGLTLSGENVDKIHNYVLAQREMKAALEGIQLQIGEQLMPVLTRFATWFSEHQDDIRNFITKASEKISAFVTDFATGWEIIQSGLKWIPDNQGAIIAAVSAIGVAMALAFGPESLAVAGLAAILVLIGAIKNKGSSLTMKEANGPNVPDLPPAQMAEWQAKQNAAFDAKTKGLGDAAASVTSDLNALGNSFKSVSSVFQDALGQIRSAASALFGQPTKEQAGLQLRSDQLAQAIGYNQASGGTSGQLAAASLQKQKDAIDAQIAQLQAKHKVEQDGLVLADKTLLTEGQQTQKANDLITATSTLTGQIQASADKIGVSLIPGFDAVIGAAAGLGGAFGDAQTAIGDFVRYVKGLGLPTGGASTNYGSSSAGQTAADFAVAGL